MLNEPKESQPVLPKKLNPAEDLQKFLEEKGYVIQLIPNFVVGDDGRIIFRGSIQVNKKALV